MFTELKFQPETPTVPWFPQTEFFRKQEGVFNFSTTKPNIIVGPNGTGKSALLRYLALLTMTHYTGVSAYDQKYADKERAFKIDWDHDVWKKRAWFLPEVISSSSVNPGMFYRPGHIPGNESWINVALMTGYSKQAHEYIDKTDKKSSGQASFALLQRMLRMVTGEDPLRVAKHRPVVAEDKTWQGMHDFQLRRAAAETHWNSLNNENNILLFDEPEQSLDALTQGKFWNALAQPAKGIQIICATHSPIPMLMKDRAHLFNFIETKAGWLDNVTSAYLGLLKDYDDQR